MKIRMVEMKRIVTYYGLYLRLYWNERTELLYDDESLGHYLHMFCVFC